MSDMQCSRMVMGKRCQHDGNVMTGNGMRYCRDCFIAESNEEKHRNARPKKEFIPPELDARVSALVPRREGESEHDWSMRCRTETLEKLKRKPKREVHVQTEPGELG